MKIFNTATKIALSFCAILLITSCEEEITSIGSGLVDEINFENLLFDDASVVAYTQNFPEGIQTNGLGVGAIGIYDDPTFGKLRANLLSQVELSRTNPDFGDDTVIDSVVFTLPYFSSQIGVADENGESAYELDSVFGSKPIKLSVYQSNYFLNGLNAEDNFEIPSIYYANEISSFQGTEGELLFTEEMFYPNDEEIELWANVDDDNDDDTAEVFQVNERIRPALRKVFKDQTTLDYWKNLIIDREGDDVLLTQNNFKNYFRGIFLKAETVNGTGSYLLFDYSNVQFTIFYSFTGDDDSNALGESTNDGQGDISLVFDSNNFGGVQVLGIERDTDASPKASQIAADINVLTDDEQNNGEETLYVEGGDVSVAIIELFKNGELETLRECGILVNEANLTLFVDQDELAANRGSEEPERLFIYDIDNNRTLVDLANDSSIGSNGPVSSKIIHLGRLQRETAGDETSAGVKYRIRLTQHINDIINNDSTNVRLAVGISQNVNLTNTALIREDSQPILSERKRVPVASILAPESTAIHGNLSPDLDKRLKLRIFYTLTEDFDPNSPCGNLLGL